MILLGDSCACNGVDCWHDGKCTVTDSRVLQVDHVYGGGKKDPARKSKGRGDRTRDMYIYYLKNPDEARQRLQVLCANCNWAKVARNNEHTGPKLLPHT